MILDERNEFADAASVANAAGTYLLGDQIDLQATGIDVGLATDLWFVISVDTEIITGGSAGTIKFMLVSDAAAAIATDGSASVHFDSGTFVTDDSAANDSQMNAGGRPVVTKLPSGASRAYERYLGVIYTIGTTTVTAGAVSAFLTPNVGVVKHYADASQ